MPGFPPKPAATRQRQNKTSTRATLPTEISSAGNEVPKLPVREAGWHPFVLEWWTDVWRSPMASEYLEVDKRGLYRMAALEHDFWSAISPSGRLAVSAEIRQMGLAFGLSPIDRRRLQWEVEKGETAAERTSTRRTRKAAGSDPRAGLKVAS